MGELVRRRMILHLGGDPARLAATVSCATLHPSAKVVLSAEYAPRELVLRLEAQGVAADRILLDYRPWDTVSNLTYGVDLARRLQITDLYVVTGARHMRRAAAIARVVCAWRGIRVHAWPLRAETHAYPEPTSRLVVDVLRSAFWRVTGLLPSNPLLKRRRMETMRPLRAEANLLGPECAVPGVHRPDPFTVFLEDKRQRIAAALRAIQLGPERGRGAPILESEGAVAAAAHELEARFVRPANEATRDAQPARVGGGEAL